MPQINVSFCNFSFFIFSHYEIWVRGGHRPLLLWWSAVLIHPWGRGFWREGALLWTALFPVCGPGGCAARASLPCSHTGTPRSGEGQEGVGRPGRTPPFKETGPPLTDPP